LYNKVFKSYQINNLNIPFKIVPVFKKEDEQIIDEANQEVPELKTVIKNKSQEMLSEANENAKLIIFEANIEADKIIEKAKIEAEEIKNLAYDSAYREGFAKAREDFQEENNSILSESEIIREQAKRDYDETVNNLEKDILKLVMEIARKVVGAELKTNSEVIVSIVKDALKRTNEKENIMIKVSQEDSEALKDNIHEIIGRETGITNVKLKKNLSLNKGDVIIETPYGSIDGSVEKKLSNIENVFNEFVAKDATCEE
jgi:flagellar assembly protein FliH